MKISVKLTWIFTLHWFLLTTGQRGKAASQCSASAGELMKEATVTCLFPSDVGLSKTDFTVYREKECIWVQGRLDCSLQPGYEQDNQLVTKHFTLRIPHFLQNHTGRYFCDVTGYEKEVCTLFQRTVPATSQELENQPTATPAPLKVSDLSLTPESYSKDHSDSYVTCNNEKTTNTVLIIVLCTVSACVAVASAASVVYVVRKWPSRKKDCHCVHLLYKRALDKSSTPRNDSRCSRHDVSQGCVDSRGRDACEVCGRCGTTEARHVTNVAEDSFDEEHCGKKPTCSKRQRLGRRAEMSNCFQQTLRMRALHEECVEKITRENVTSKRLEDATSSCGEEKVHNCITLNNIQMNGRHSNERSLSQYSEC